MNRLRAENVSSSEALRDRSGSFDVLRIQLWLFYLDLGDEIDRLTFTFSRLVERINLQMEKLQKADMSRRELVANVSHDLRTPLATLQGYIETLFLKDKNLTAQERKQHLEIAIRHCERLAKLVDALFELAKLDSHEARARYEALGRSRISHHERTCAQYGHHG
ncbi:MAG: histidine kinase dimerization/phospho-acceptor domain-containing protein [Anaerolineales bacterium]